MRLRRPTIALLSMLLALAGVLAAPASASSDSSPAVCDGAVLDDNYVLIDGIPRPRSAPYGDLAAYNPQNLATVVIASLRDERNTSEQQTCLATLAADTLLAGSEQVTHTRPDRTTAIARRYPYDFAFSANPATPVLEPGWHSALAAGSAMEAFSRLYERTANQEWRVAAAETFESYLTDDGFVTRRDGLTFLQEYLTSPDSYVLNGDNQALLALMQYADRTLDPRAAGLVSELVSSLERVLPLYDATLPSGAASAYDLLRGYPAAPVRLVSSRALRLRAAAVVSGSTQLSSLALPIVSSAGRAAPNLLVNGGFASWTGAGPAGWSSAVSTTPRSFTPVAGGARIVSSGNGWESLRQDVPAAAVRPATWYRLSWLSRLVRTPGLPASSGRATVQALCPTGAVTLGEEYAARGTSFSRFDVLVRTPSASCGLRVILYQNDWRIPGTLVDVGDVSIGFADGVAGGVTPRYPLSVLATPSVSLSINYTGAGSVQMWSAGRWRDVAALPSSVVPRSVAVPVPGWAQGRNINLGYHEHHVQELAALARRTGSSVFASYVARWLPLAPAMTVTDGEVGGITTHSRRSPSATGAGAPATLPEYYDPITQPRR